jgi:hypothetical protein
MNLILEALRDPIWQFIGVVFPVVSAVVIYAWRKLWSRKNRTNNDTNSSAVKPIARKLKPGEELMLFLYTILSLPFAHFHGGSEESPQSFV